SHHGEGTMSASVSSPLPIVGRLGRWAAGAAGLIAAAILIAAALPTPTPAATPQATTLIVGSSFIIRSIDPGRTVETTSNMINHATYDSLVSFDGEDLRTPKPSLATEWKVSEDGKTYTFKLRPNVKFSGGNPLTSADFKWSFERVKNLKSNPAFYLDPVAEIQTPDPLTLVLKLKAPNPALLAILSSPSLGAVDSKLVAQKGGVSGPEAKSSDKAESFLNSQSAGTGAFILSSYVPEQEIVLVRNPNHWRPAPAVDRIVIRNITEPATQKLQIQRGDIDIATALGQDQIAGLRNVPNVSIRSSLAATTFYVLMNNNPEVGQAFSHPKVQEAVRYALDYDGILTIAGAGASRLAGVIPTGFPGALDPRTANKTDREKSKALLKEAGLSEVKGQITYGSDQVIWGVQMAVLAQKIQADLAAVGIQLSLNGLPRATALQLYRDAKNQVGVWSWAADFPDGSNFLVFIPGRTVGKRAGWPEDASPASKELAELARKAESEIDDARRAALMLRIDKRVVEIGPYAPLFQPAVPVAFRSNVKGVTFHSVWGLDFYTISK
ncbi:MAG TPA: ABC transporter substrate-binding protein, partial [Candidatus Methylomirabilis sp.]|nr:ABC transporter substrate-binding protein [Candidatus Methylomirabilis sp.]